MADENTPDQEPSQPTSGEEYATLGRVPTPQAVPAAPGQHVDAPGELSPVSQATINRLLGTE